MIVIDKNYILKFLINQRQYLKRKYGVENISLYGSFARGEESEESDIDFIVEMPPSFHDICALEEYLEKVFHRKIDIIRKHSNLRKRFVEEIQKDTISV